MANYLANQLGGNSLVSAVSDAISKTTVTDDEKKEQNNEITRASVSHEAKKTILERRDLPTSHADIASVRQAEHRTEESEPSSCLARNVHHLLALGIMGLTFVLYSLVIYGSTKEGFLRSETKDIVIYILGALTTVATQVVSYYFGSSASSVDKSKTLSALAKRG